jgi:hypothetical protein
VEQRSVEEFAGFDQAIFGASITTIDRNTTNKELTCTEIGPFGSGSSGE